MICISEKVRLLCPGLSIGYLLYDIDGTSRPCNTSTAIHQAIENFNKRKIALASEQEDIYAAREAMRKFGRNPSKYRVSSEALVKRVIQDGELPSINAVVDINNSVSIQSCMPVGSYNFSRVHGDITVDLGADNELYETINRGAINLENVLLLRDFEGPFGSIIADSKRTMVEDQQRVLMVIFCFRGDGHITEALNYAEKVILEYLPAQISRRAVV